LSMMDVPTTTLLATHMMTPVLSGMMPTQILVETMTPTLLLLQISAAPVLELLKLKMPQLKKPQLLRRPQQLSTMDVLTTTLLVTHMMTPVLSGMMPTQILVETMTPILSLLQISAVPVLELLKLKMSQLKKPQSLRRLQQLSMMDVPTTTLLATHMMIPVLSGMIPTQILAETMTLTLLLQQIFVVPVSELLKLKQLQLLRLQFLLPRLLLPLMQHLLIALMTIALEIRMVTPVLIGIFLDLRLVETMILMSSLLPICAASACGKTKLPRQLNSKQTSNTLLTSLLRTLLLSSPWTTVITAIILRTT